MVWTIDWYFTQRLKATINGGTCSSCELEEKAKKHTGNRLSTYQPFICGMLTAFASTNVEAVA